MLATVQISILILLWKQFDLLFQRKHHLFQVFLLFLVRLEILQQGTLCSLHKAKKQSL